MSTKPRRRSAITALFAAAIVLLLAIPAAASADPLGEITEYSTGLNVGAKPLGIALGPDGNLWFTDRGTSRAIGRITPSGTITELAAGEQPGGEGNNVEPLGIAPGSDGNVWFTDPGGIVNPGWPMFGRVTPAGVITEFGKFPPLAVGLPENSAPLGIAAGPDGNLWFTDPAGVATTGETAIGRMTPSGTVTLFSTGLQSNSVPLGIAAGPDGNLWFTDQGGFYAGSTNKIGRITPSGVITEFSVPAGVIPGDNHTFNNPPEGIAPGPDGNVWFAEQSGVNEKQTVTLEGSGTLGGTFTLTFKGQTTSAISATATTTTVKSALEALSTIGTGNVKVSVAGSNPKTYSVTFQGALASTDVEVMTCGAGSLTPAGATCTVATPISGVTNKIGRITPSGTITEYSTGLNAAAKPAEIALGPDGNLWFTDEGVTKAIGRITPSGTITEYSTGLQASNGSKPSSIAPGPDGNLWFTDEGTTAAIGRIGTAPPKQTLTVSDTGAGTGEVTSSPAGITCGGDCEEEYEEGTPVTLTASAAGGSVFTGWSGSGCSGTGTCEVTMSAAKEVEAQFEPSYVLKVVKTAGSGTVVSTSSAGINCGSECQAPFKKASTVTLTASPAAGYTINSWSGCKAKPTALTCTVEMDKGTTEKPKEVKVSFLAIPSFSIEKAGSGAGKVSATGISCDESCSKASAAIKSSTVVLVKTTAAKGSEAAVFLEGEGSAAVGVCEGESAGPCTFPISADSSVKVKFNPIPTKTLTVNLTGYGAYKGKVAGKGIVKGLLGAAISCGSGCSTQTESFFSTDEVTLTATVPTGYAFGGWTGCDSEPAPLEEGKPKRCLVATSSNKTVSAEFK